MVTIKTDLTLIKLAWRSKTYIIKAEKVKDTVKHDMEKTYACDSHDPNYLTFGKCEYSIDLSGVQSHRTLFEQIQEAQVDGSFNGNYPRIAVYKYDKTGKASTDKYYIYCFVEEISGENQDPYDVKLVSMRRVLRNSKNELYSG